MPASLHEGILSLDGTAALRGLPPTVSLVDDPTGAGVFLRLRVEQTGSWIHTPLGAIDGLARFTSLFRSEPWWMTPRTGRSHAEIAPDTQWLLAETSGGRLVLVVPLLDEPFRFALWGSPGGLSLAAETGDPAVWGDGGIGVFVGAGTDAFAMVRAGVRAVQLRLGIPRLRADKPPPAFVDDFGWCTWDAFYESVSAEKVRTGLASFAEGGVEPRFMILDDGWQSAETRPAGETRLVSMRPNAKFGGDLSATVAIAKRGFKVRTFLVWHAMSGYWAGVSAEAFPGYGVRDAARSFSPGVLAHRPDNNVRLWGPLVGVVPPEHIGRFFDEYHGQLRAQGVDGVKVDNQALLEGVAAGNGGRIALDRAYRRALEASVRRHFGGCLINCMASGQETWYGARDTTVARTSTDFWPQRPTTHGLHQHTNALVGLWFGEFMLPDWDMFQSAHPMGAFHAAGRAVSGGPVYVSDKPGEHDFALLRRLVLSDGTVLRADQPGRPTRDCLFADPTRDPVLFKVFNTTAGTGLVALFNCHCHADPAARRSLAGGVGPNDVEGLAGERFAAFFHRAGRVAACARADRFLVELAEGEWEIVTFAPVDGGAAVLGLADKLAGAAAVSAKRRRPDGALEVDLRDGGSFLAWCEKPPRAVQAGGQPAAFTYDAATGRLDVPLAAQGPQTVAIVW
jgi:raffinose synthase